MEEKPKVIYKIKKSTGKTVAIVILLLLLLCSLFYIGYTEYKKLIYPEKIEEKEERTEMYYSEVQKILKQIDMYNEILKSEYPIHDINKIDNQLKLQFGIYALQEDEKIHNYYQIEDMKDIYSKYLVKDFKTIYEDIKCPMGDDVLYKLDNDTKKYTLVDTHQHGMVTMNVNTYFVSGKIEDNKYIIETNILYSGYCNGVCNTEGGYYDSYHHCIEGKNPMTYQLSEYASIKDNLPITTFTFIKDSSNFRLESVKIDNE